MAMVRPSAALAHPASASQLVAAFCIGLTFMLLELVVGLITSSLALLVNAAHVGTDVLGDRHGAHRGLARTAGHARCCGRTFGLYRTEVLAALANTALLFGVAGYVLYQAIGRIAHPKEVPGLPVCRGRRPRRRSGGRPACCARVAADLNLRGAYLEVLSDLIGSLGVLSAG